MANNSSGLQGSKDVLDNLKKLSDQQVISSFRTAGRRAMRDVLADAKRRADSIDDPESPNSIGDNLGIRVTYRNDELTVSVGVRGGARYRRGDKAAGLVTYWRYVELGTQYAPAQPFLRPALADNHQQVFQQFVQEMRTAINRRL